MYRNLPVWKTSPFVRILIAFIPGICLHAYCGKYIPFLTVATLLAICLTFCLAYNFFRVGIQFRLRMFSGLCIYAALLSCGYMVHYFSDPRVNPDWFGYSLNDAQSLVVKIEEPLLERPSTFKSVATVLGYYDSTSYYPATGSMLLYFRKDSALPHFRYGDILVIRSPVQSIVHNNNPGSFDYAAYCAGKGIFHQSFVQIHQLRHTGINKANYFKNALFTSRQRIIDILQQYIRGNESRGLAEALLIGYKDDLDKDLLMAYTNTGVVHVIAISGLHLGLVYWMLAGIFKKLPLRTPVIPCLLTISGLWIFSAISGGAPSVMRSAAMFSIMLTGEMINRKAFSINSLAASALMLLCYSPSWLWDIGFQLSYMAVLGLICLSGPVYKAVLLVNPLLDYLWKMNAVTISATLLTLPVTTYYFHQFPLLFLITNSVIVPLSGIILFALIIICILSFLPPLAGMAGMITEQLIIMMNEAVKYFDALPFGLLRGLKINIPQVYLMYLFILFTSYFFIKREKKYLFPALITLLTCLFIRAMDFYKAERRMLFIAYQVRGGGIIEIIQGRTAFLLVDETQMNDRNIQYYTLNPSHNLHRVKNLKIASKPSSLNMIFEYGKNDKKRILILGGQHRGTIPRDLPEKSVGIIISGRVQEKYIEWLKTSAAGSLEFLHRLDTEGAFVRNLQFN